MTTITLKNIKNQAIIIDLDNKDILCSELKKILANKLGDNFDDYEYKFIFQGNIIDDNLNINIDDYNGKNIIYVKTKKKKEDANTTNNNTNNNNTTNNNTNNNNTTNNNTNNNNTTNNNTNTPDNSPNNTQNINFENIVSPNEMARYIMSSIIGMMFNNQNFINHLISTHPSFRNNNINNNLDRGHHHTYLFEREHPYIINITNEARNILGGEFVRNNNVALVFESMPITNISTIPINIPIDLSGNIINNLSDGLSNLFNLFNNLATTRPENLNREQETQQNIINNIPLPDLPDLIEDNEEEQENFVDDDEEDEDDNDEQYLANQDEQEEPYEDENLGIEENTHMNTLLNQLLPNDLVEINNIVSLGYNRYEVIQMYLVCNKDVNLTVRNLMN
jgi:hypothetical protein